MNDRYQTPSRLNVAEAKKRFSDLLGRVAYRGETFVILRRGKPMAKLVPCGEDPARPLRLSEVQGWLNDDDPFFSAIEEIVSSRQHHEPRVLPRKRKGKGPRN